MSVDSFIQQRISLDASSTSEHSSTATTPHRATFRIHQSGSGSGSALNNAGTTPEPAVDPRWQMAPPGGADAQHAFFRSIESELPETDRIAIHHATQSSSRQQQLQQEATASTAKRHSVLRGKAKQLAKLPIGGNGVSNSSPPVSGTGYPEGGRAASTSISSTRRPAVSSAGNSLPQTSSSSSNLSSSSVGATTTGANGRRANPPGPINVNTTRARTYSLGGSTSSANNSVGATTGNGTPAGSGSYPPPPAPLRLATDHPMSPLGEGDGQEDTSEYCIAIVGSRGCGKTMLVRKIVKRYTIVETRELIIGGTIGQQKRIYLS